LKVPCGPGIRDDSGVEANSEVSIHYDPLISKLAAWGRTRDEAIDRLRRAVDEYELAGIKTTLPFFREIVRDDEFQSGLLDTDFISRFNQRRNAAAVVESADQSSDHTDDDIALIAAAVHYARLQRAASRNGQAPVDSKSHWKMSGRRLDPRTYTKAH
jgi:acetyl/propionyl-CoA carboxylase alpha subunit